MGRAQSGRAFWDGLPFAQIGIVRDDICADQALPGCGHPFGDANATGDALGFADQSTFGFGHHFLDHFGQCPPIETMLQVGKVIATRASGALSEFRAGRIQYSAETAHQLIR